MRRSAARIERLSAQGRDLAALRAEALDAIRDAMTVDAAFFATVDPSTLLFTSAAADEPLDAVSAEFLTNEYGAADVNKFVALAEGADPVGSLDQATGDRRGDSSRYRDLLAPLGLGDEVRLALVANNGCWGVLCLHRADASAGFDPAELAFLRRVGPLLAEGVRRSVALLPPAVEDGAVAAPGIVVVDEDLAVRSTSRTARAWLEELSSTAPTQSNQLPAPIAAAAARAFATSGDDAAGGTTTRVPRPAGGWIAVHAAPLEGGERQLVAVILEPAGPAEVSSLLLSAHGLTPAQCRVVGLVLRGYSTHAIVRELQISPYTVQEHLHAVFDRLGIGSRRELVATLSGRRR